jgi:hypothetical protein|tara:strand:+ start:513 stop:767 length:255 start_codon:yes stop_codon:yes gene_type:complete
MNVLRKIINNWGFLDKCDIRELAESLPLAKVCIKWGLMPREMLHVEDVLDRIDKVVKDDKDYVREIFFIADDLKLLKQVLGNYE